MNTGVNARGKTRARCKSRFGWRNFGIWRRRSRYRGEEREQEGKIGGICKYFSNPRGKPRLRSFPPRLSGDYPTTIEPLPFILFFPSGFFFRFLPRASHAAFCFFLPFISSRYMRKKKGEKKRTKARVGNRGVLFFSFIYIGSRLIPARASSLFASSLCSRRVSAFSEADPMVSIAVLSIVHCAT